MRRSFIIAALAMTALMHIYTGDKLSATQSPKGQPQTSGDISDPVLKLSNISASMQGDRITAVGQIGGIWEPTEQRAPHTLVLRDDTGVLEIVHWLYHPPHVEVGDSVQCTGTVDLYRGRLQLRLWTPGDLKVLDP